MTSQENGHLLGKIAIEDNGINRHNFVSCLWNSLFTCSSEEGMASENRNFGRICVFCSRSCGTLSAIGEWKDFFFHISSCCLYSYPLVWVSDAHSFTLNIGRQHPKMYSNRFTNNVSLHAQLADHSVLSPTTCSIAAVAMFFLEATVIGYCFERMYFLVALNKYVNNWMRFILYLM